MDQKLGEFQSRTLLGIGIQIAVILLGARLYQSGFSTHQADLIFLSVAILVLSQLLLGATLLSPALLLGRIHEVYPDLEPSRWRAMWLKLVRFCPPSYALLVLFFLLKERQGEAAPWIFRKPARGALFAIVPAIALYGAFILSQGEAQVSGLGYWAASPGAAYVFAQGEYLAPILRNGSLDPSKSPIELTSTLAERMKEKGSGAIGPIIAQATLMKRLSKAQATEASGREIAEQHPSDPTQLLDTLEQVISVTEIWDRAPRRYFRPNFLSIVSPGSLIEGGLITFAEEAIALKYRALLVPQLDDLLTHLAQNLPASADRIGTLQARLRATQTYQLQLAASDSRIGRVIAAAGTPKFAGNPAR